VARSVGRTDGRRGSPIAPEMTTGLPRWAVRLRRSSGRLARTLLEILLLQRGDPDGPVRTRPVPRPGGTRRSRRPASAKPAFHAFPAGAGGRSAYISTIRAAPAKGQNRRIHAESRDPFIVHLRSLNDCPALQLPFCLLNGFNVAHRRSNFEETQR
jgi:hypothetical protein